MEASESYGDSSLPHASNLNSGSIAVEVSIFYSSSSAVVNELNAKESSEICCFNGSTLAKCFFSHFFGIITSALVLLSHYCIVFAVIKSFFFVVSAINIIFSL